MAVTAVGGPGRGTIRYAPLPVLYIVSPYPSVAIKFVLSGTEFESGA